MQELSGTPANLPDSLVRAPPIISQPIQQTLDGLPSRVGDWFAVLVRQIDGIHHLAVNIELQLLVRSIANPHWPRILVAAKLIERDLREILSPIHTVHNLQRTSLGIVAQPALQPVDEGLGFIDEA